MRKSFLLLGLLLALLVTVPSAGAAEHKWFTQFSVGSGGSQGPFSIEGLESAQAYTLGLGYNLTPHITLLPLELGFQRFSSSDRLGGYLHNSILRRQAMDLAYLKEQGIDVYFDIPDYGDVQGTAELSGVTFRSGVQFQASLTGWLSGFTHLGALALRSELTTVSTGGNFPGLNRSLTQSGMSYGFWLGAGLEHELRSGISLTAALDYDRLYRHVDPATNTYFATRESGHMFGRIVPASRSHFYNFSLGLRLGL